MAKIGVSIIAKWGNVQGVASFEVDTPWLALDPKDSDKMKDFKIGSIHNIEITHDNGSFRWPGFGPNGEDDEC